VRCPRRTRGSMAYARRSLYIEIHHSYLVDRITAIDKHSCALHKTRFAAGQEKNAVCHFLSTSHAAHWCNTHGWLEDCGVGLGHWSINHAWTDAVDADLVFGVLVRIESVCVHVVWWACYERLTSIASHFVMLMTAAFEPQYAAVHVHFQLAS
jgi:hypothetical protein